MVDKLTPIIQIAGENPEIAPVVGIAYRGYQIINGLATIEEKLREAKKLEEDRVNIERKFANYVPQQGWSSTGGYIASRPNRTAAAAAQSQAGTFIASRPPTPFASSEEKETNETDPLVPQEEDLSAQLEQIRTEGDNAFDNIYNRINARLANIKRIEEEKDRIMKNGEQRLQDQKLAQEEAARQNAELLRIASENKYRDQGPIFLDEEANLYRQFAEEERLAQLEEEAKRRERTIRQRFPVVPTGNTTDEKLDFYRNRVAAITAAGDILLDDADLADTPFNIANPAGPRPRFQNGVGYTPILVGGLAMVGGYINRSIQEPNPFTPPNVQNPTYTLPPTTTPIPPPMTPNPGPATPVGTTTTPISPTIPFLVPPNTTPTVSTDGNPIINPIGVITNPIVNPVVPIDALAPPAPLVIVKENFVPRTISIAPALVIGLAGGATLTTLAAISKNYFMRGNPSSKPPTKKRKHD